MMPTKNTLKNSIILLLVCFACKSYGQTNITVSPETEYQTIEGWGVSLAWWANLAGGWSQSTIDELAGYAVNDLNYNVFRFNIGAGENPSCTAGDHIRKDGGLMPDYRSPKANNQGWGQNNLTKDYRQISVMNKLAALRQSKGDIITEMISYSPPWWMTYGECTAGNISATTENLKPEFIDDFADYLASVSADLKSAHSNWNIQHIEPFNEPMSGFWAKGGNQQGSGIYPATQAQVIWRLWQSKQTYNIASVGISGSDNSKVPTAITNMTALRDNNPNEYNGLDKINTHSYGGTWQQKQQLATFAKNNGNKRIWQTETGPLSWTPPQPGQWWLRHFDMANRLIEDVRNLKSTVWCDWQLLSRDDGWGMVQQTNWNENTPYQQPVLKKTRGFYCRKNVTNFIKVGYKIIDTNFGNSVAALSPDGKELIFVISNYSANATNYNINLSKFPAISSFKTYRTSGETTGIGEDTTEKTAATISEKGVLNNKNLSYNARPYSITTFKIQLGSGAIANGFYQIQQRGSGKCLNVAGWGGDNAAVVQWGCVNQNNSKFYVEQQNNGTYEIRVSYNDKAITVPSQAANGDATTIYTDSNQSNQRFTFENVGNGFYKIALSALPEKALAIDAPNINDQGEPVIVWNYYNTNNFHWKFNPTTTSQTVAVKAVLSDNTDESIKMYPNPVNDGVLKINSSTPSKLEIFDIYGRLLLKDAVTKPESEIQLNKSVFKSGIYVLKMLDENGNTTSNHKIIIE